MKDGRAPDAAECAGGLLCVIGSLVIRFWPR
jgi:drug/metabolite transporter superfamily protein YnfA